MGVTTSAAAMAGNGSVETQLKREVTCLFCQGVLDDPRILECLHVYCKSCIEGMKLKASEPRYKCPQCSETLIIKEIEKLPSFTLAKFHTRNLQLLRRTTKIETRCEVCLKEPALYICVDCREGQQFVCHNCSLPHYHRPELKDHILELVTDFPAAVAPESVRSRKSRRSTLVATSLCIVHGLQYKFFCQTCSTGLCNDCVKDNTHHDHNLIQTGDPVQDAQKMIQIELLDILQLRDLLLSSLKPLEEVRQSIERQEEFIDGEIKSRFVRLKKELEFCEKNLTNQLQSVSQSKRGLLQRQAHQVSQLIEKADRLSKLLSQSADMPDETSLMSLMNLLIEKAKEMKKEFTKVLSDSVGTSPKAKVATIRRQVSLTPCELPNIALLLHPDDVKSSLREQARIYIKTAQPENSFAFGPGLLTPHALRLTYFSVQLNDANNQQVLQPHDLQIKITIEGLEGIYREKPRVIHKNKGKYIVSYCPRVHGKAEIRVSVDENEIRGSPFYVDILSASPLAHDHKTFTSLEQLRSPSCIAIDSESGILFVYDKNAGLVTLDSKGTVLSIVKCPWGGISGMDVMEVTGDVFISSSECHCIASIGPEGDIINQIGSKGTKDGQFNTPIGILATDDEVFVCDSLNHRIQVFDDELKLKRSLSTDFSKNQQYPHLQLPGQPVAVTTNENGTILVSDAANKCILLFSSGERFQRSFWQLRRVFSDEVCSVNQVLGRPLGIACDTDGHLYVSDTSKREREKERAFIDVITFALR